MRKSTQSERERTLAVAECIVREKGSSELTHGNLAQEAGITKGGVQSRFGSKGGLLEALLLRWVEHLDIGIQSEPESPDRSPMQRHVVAGIEWFDVNGERFPSLLAALSQPQEHLEPLREWYRTHLGDGEAATQSEQRQRLAFLAFEGLNLLHHLGLMEFSDDALASAQRDILCLSNE